MTIFQDSNLEFSNMTGFLKNSQTDIKLKIKIRNSKKRLGETFQPPTYWLRQKTDNVREVIHLAIVNT